MSAKQKKESKEAKLKRELLTQLKTQGVNGTAVARLSPNGLGKSYVVAHDGGLSIYRHKGNAFDLVDTRSWNLLHSGSVDHYALKSVFDFKSSQPLHLVVDEGGKELARVINSNVVAGLYVVSRPFGRKILGFRSKTRWKMITSSVIYVLIAVFIIGAFSGGQSSSTDKSLAASAPPSNTTSKATNATASSTNTSSPSSKQSTTPPPQQPTKPATQTPPDMKQVAMDVVHQAIGKSNLMKNGDAFLGAMAASGSEPYIILVEAQDNFTQNMVKNGILMDTETIIQNLYKDKRFNNVRIVWYYPVTDAYGNQTNAVAEKIDFSRATVNLINWDNFLWENIPKVADDFVVNPAFDSGN